MEPSNSPEEKNESDQKNLVQDSEIQDSDENSSNNSDSNENSSDSDVDFYCEVCDKYFSGIKPLKQHQKSGKHIKTLKKKKLQKEIDNDLQNDENSDEDNFVLRKNSYTICEICEKEFSGPEPYIQHLKSKGHRQKCNEKKILAQAKVGDTIDMEKLKEIVKDSETFTGAQYKPTDSDSKSIWTCADCEKNFSGMEPFRVHMNSKSHERMLRQKALKQDLGGESSDVSYLESVDDDLICRLCHVSFSGPESAIDHLKSRGHSKKLEIQEWKKEQKQSKTQFEEKGREIEREKLYEQNNPNKSETTTKCYEVSNKTELRALNDIPFKKDDEARSDDSNRNNPVEANTEKGRNVDKENSQGPPKKMGPATIFASCLKNF